MMQETSPGRGLESLEAASARRRAELARDYLMEADVLTKLDIDHETLVTWRRARKLLAVWYQPENLYLYPPYQFNETGVIAEVEPLLDISLKAAPGRAGTRSSG